MADRTSFSWTQRGVGLYKDCKKFWFYIYASGSNLYSQYSAKSGIILLISFIYIRRQMQRSSEAIQSDGIHVLHTHDRSRDKEQRLDFFTGHFCTRHFITLHFVTGHFMLPDKSLHDIHYSIHFLSSHISAPICSKFMTFLMRRSSSWTIAIDN
jgi:hypothetical protein